MKLILVRHGQTPSNVAGLLDTAPPGPALTDLGRLQARAAAAVLADTPVDALFASNQLRAQLTADPLGEQQNLQTSVLEGLREISAGELEMAGDADSVHRYIGILISWLEGDLARRIPGGPTGVEVLDRYDAAISQIVSEVGGDGTAVAVSHGAAIRVWAEARGLAEVGGGWSDRHLDNTGAVTLERTGGGAWRVVDWHREALGGVQVDPGQETGPTG